MKSLVLRGPGGTKASVSRFSHQCVGEGCFASIAPEHGSTNVSSQHDTGHGLKGDRRWNGRRSPFACVFLGASFDRDGRGENGFDSASSLELFCTKAYPQIDSIFEMMSQWREAISGCWPFSSLQVAAVFDLCV